MSRFKCSFEGCENDPLVNGVAVYRTSPKGGPFVGRCEAHLDEEPDTVLRSVVDVIQGRPKGTYQA